MRYGYARVSTTGQNLKVQTEQLEQYGVDKLFKEKVSGTSRGNRNAFNELLNTVQQGDSIVITKLDRMARSTLDALTVIKQLDDKGVSLIVLNLNGDKLDTSTANGKLLITMLSAIAEFEVSLSKERQREGIEQAKQRGVYKGRPKKYTKNNKALQHAIDLYNDRDNNKMSVNDISEVTGVSRATIYRNVK